jgi:hypothetical protein
MSCAGVDGRQVGEIVLVVSGPLSQLGERAAGEGLAQLEQLIGGLASARQSTGGRGGIRHAGGIGRGEPQAGGT